MQTTNPYANLKKDLQVGGNTYQYFSLPDLNDQRLAKLPFSVRVLLESAIRNCGKNGVSQKDVETILDWENTYSKQSEVLFKPSRVILQDFTGVPAVVDLAAMRDTCKRLGGDPDKINPLVPVDLVIDHSVQVDEYGRNDALDKNLELEMQRNAERFTFLKWGANAFKGLTIVPPGAGIVHQVNLEYLGRCVFKDEAGVVYPDSVVGTDSHTPMINGLGVVGWGVGGIEAEGVMLDQPISMVLPEVIGYKLVGQFPSHATATDLVLAITKALRAKGVVEKFVEFFGPAVEQLSIADRATISNMSPEMGATICYFPVDNKTLDYLRLTGRSDEQIAYIEAYLKAQGLFRDYTISNMSPEMGATICYFPVDNKTLDYLRLTGRSDEQIAYIEAYLKAQGLFRDYTNTSQDPVFTDVLELDLSTIIPCLSGPKRPHDYVALSNMKADFAACLTNPVGPKGFGLTAEQVSKKVSFEYEENGEKKQGTLTHGSVVIAAITSCTNTSNPSVMIAAGLVARNAVKKGLKVPSYIKTSLAPGSGVVTEYLKKSGLLPFLEQLGFNVVGYGCTTCIGNSGPLPAPVSAAIEEGDLVASGVLSGNRNFEGRIHPLVRANYLASPPLVVSYAIAGSTLVDLDKEPIGTNDQGEQVFLKDIWPTQEEIAETIKTSVLSEMFKEVYGAVTRGTPQWNSLKAPTDKLYPWDESSTYIHNPPFFSSMELHPSPQNKIEDAHVLLLAGDFITTDHISPAGNISVRSPAARYLMERGVDRKDFNSYGARRGNDQVMARGTFANIRLTNKLLGGKVGPQTIHHPTGEVLDIWDAAERYINSGTPLTVLAGEQYGSGSSRDWAAKGVWMQNVKFVIAKSFERIHRSNLVLMGIIPLEFVAGEDADKLGLTGKETFSIDITGAAPRSTVTVKVNGGAISEFKATLRIDTETEVNYFKHGGVLPTVIRQVLGTAQ